VPEVPRLVYIEFALWLKAFSGLSPPDVSALWCEIGDVWAGEAVGLDNDDVCVACGSFEGVISRAARRGDPPV